ncbi:23S rRNA (pseudouridine(1915)-N(3))-methyltransferase RlmH [Pontivivens ytuae]|uniref:Ribosomal RNA large subunit methyltransferase H n=1 Tax=Pontivivens ytuae TaxID=2789856 RepID=A0A7S9QAY0_9RHOB|nr:23S rRNA (pseudouridine(1915)-N(3))-methyltransferase RlmH [Pontivivens ytuae]QPH52563.1 23S rRNA (pseudouridine(1915)-N(3))-methyltransferase RlmH [Pontivivens ytuae]
MRVTIAAVGRLRSGPERDMVEDYLTRYARTGRALGFSPAQLTEVEDRKAGGMAAEAKLLAAAIPAGAVRVMLDERGRQLTSPDFATRLMGWAEEGRRDVALVIGGADGIAPELRETADLKVSFGAMVWPHALVRVMLAEQLYRAATILAGTPYHRV